MDQSYRKNSHGYERDHSRSCRIDRLDPKCFVYSDNINAAKESIAGLQSKQAVCAETLRQLNAGMRVTLTSHHQMINDVRSVLKIMAKV